MKKLFKKALIGILLGVVVLAVFVYFGGGKYLQAFGAKTEQAGVKLEGYEMKMKNTTKEAEVTVKKTAGAVKDTAVSAKDKVGKTYDKTKEKVKEYMPNDKEAKAKES